MKKILLATFAGLVLDLSVPSAAAPGGRPAACRQLVDLVLAQYDRNYASSIDLERFLHFGAGRDRVERAYIRSLRIDATWARFNRLSKTCARFSL